MMRLAPVSRLAPALDFIGSTSGPLTMKWPLTSRMVSVVIALPYPILFVAHTSVTEPQ
jgi:hypothetical protein